MLLNTEELLHKALEYKGQVKDLDIALKYAAMSVISTWSPRADACCVMGEVYLERGNLQWSKFWYEKAVNNMSCGVDEELPDSKYFTTIPMLKLGYIDYKMGNYKSALEYFEAVLNIEPDNEIAKDNIASIKAEMPS
jgi:tetratricopeptide (TPR) repeat protein